MSNKMTPQEVLNSIEEGINSGDLDSLMTLYEADACFATQPGLAFNFRVSKIILSNII